MRLRACACVHVPACMCLRACAFVSVPACMCLRVFVPVRALCACVGGSGTPDRLSPEPGALCQEVVEVEVVGVEVVIVIPLVVASEVKREIGIIQCPLGAFFIWKWREPGLG